MATVTSFQQRHLEENVRSVKITEHEGYPCLEFALNLPDKFQASRLTVLVNAVVGEVEANGIQPIETGSLLEGNSSRVLMRLKEEDIPKARVLAQQISGRTRDRDFRINK